ncbi:MAG TPA: hypothetical protein VFV66_14735, partial [Nonomuraea sp.]|nr:hypothetical protein [Nonomuraea sp.]
MQDPTEPDRPEILSGPGDVRLAEKSAGRSARSPGGKSKAKIIVIAAAALVAVLAAGGVGYLLASDTVSAPSATQDGARPAPTQTDPLH